MFLPHPQFTVEFVEAQNGHAETIMDRCRPCGGTGQVRAATGERREASCDPETEKPFGEQVSVGEARR